VEHERPASALARDSLVPNRAMQWVRLLVLIAGGTLLVAVLRLWEIGTWPDWLDFGRACLLSEQERACRYSLAHGRDLIALICLWLLYACLCLVGGMRSDIADRRYVVFGSQLQWPGAGDNSRPWLIPVVVLLAVTSVFYFSDSPPVSADLRIPWLFSIVVLICGAGFLISLGWQLKNFTRLTVSLSRCIPKVRERPGMGDWPSAQLMQELMQTPFNLSLGRRDIAALLRRSPYKWMRTTRRVMGDSKFSGWPDLTNEEFQAWQRQLIAELKLLVVAIRTCAWCAMVAPLAVLLAMSAYPPVYQRWLTTLSMFLLLSSFLYTILVVLRLEKDPMLGPMFTRHGDDLSLGGAVRALWPKFVAMGAVLIPLVLPDVWSGLHNLIRSINSLG
jgi:hypothetical protein